MIIRSVDRAAVSNSDTIVLLSNTLDDIASAHKMKVSDMIQSARDAADSGSDWQMRVVRIADRLDNLRSKS